MYVIYAVDALTVDPTGITPAMIGGLVAATPATLIILYGAARAGASLCNEMRNAVFAQVCLLFFHFMFKEYSK